MQGGVVAPVAEVEMLRDSVPDGGSLPDVQTHALVEPEDAVEVDCAVIRTKIAANGF